MVVGNYLKSSFCIIKSLCFCKWRKNCRYHKNHFMSDHQMVLNLGQGVLGSLSWCWATWRCHAQCKEWMLYAQAQSWSEGWSGQIVEETLWPHYKSDFVLPFGHLGTETFFFLVKFSLSHTFNYKTPYEVTTHS